MNIDLKYITDQIAVVARNCGKTMLEAKSTDIKRNEKSGHRDLVTEYDVRVQKQAIRELSEKFPEAVFFCEEGNDKDDLTSGMTFVIDPIDGTANFANNMNISCISIACFIDGVPSAGVVFDPYTDELFSASVGNGAYLNGKPISVTDAPLDGSLVMFGTSPYNIELLDRTLEKLKYIFPKCLDVRRCGSAALDICAVAAGKAGLFFEEILALWDYAAALVILHEAGGDAYNMKGEALPLDGSRTNIIAGPAHNIEASGLLKDFK